MTRLGCKASSRPIRSLSWRCLESPGPQRAFEEVTEELPEAWPFTKKWVIGLAGLVERDRPDPQAA
jgi:hypothetical protein